MKYFEFFKKQPKSDNMRSKKTFCIAAACALVFILVFTGIAIAPFSPVTSGVEVSNPVQMMATEPTNAATTSPAVESPATVPLTTEPLATAPVESETTAPEVTETTEATTNPEEQIYTEVDEIVYATTDVNIRIGPGTKYEQIDILKQGQTIHRVAIGTNNWSKVMLDEEVVFISSKYLAKTESLEFTASNLDSYAPSSGSSNTSDPYVGHFSIPSGGVNVSCYSSWTQKTVDAADSAAYYYGNGHMTIADHVDQGFSGIKSCNVGTKATFTTESGTKNYSCVAKMNGINTGHGITDANGNSVRDLYPGALMCYTCNNSTGSITIVFFMPDEGHNVYVDNGGNLNEFDSVEEETSHVQSRFCDALGKEHIWGEWKEEWRASSGSFVWMSRDCTVCPEEDWEMIIFDEEEEEPISDPQPTETTPEATEPPATEPPVTEPLATEPAATTPPATEAPTEAAIMTEGSEDLTQP